MTTSRVSDERKNRKRLYWIRALAMILFTGVVFVLVNVGLNYGALLLVYLKNSGLSLINSGTISKLSDHWTFDPRYLIIPPNPIPVALTIVLSGMIAIVWGWKIIKKTERFWEAIAIDYRPDEIDGTSRWATIKEIEKMLTPVEKSKLDTCEKSGLILAEDDSRYFIDTSTVNTLVIGKTRSGKGQGFVLPSIRQAALSQEKASLVVVDPKGENLENTYALLKSVGYRIWVVNYRDPLTGLGYNNLYAIVREYKNQMDIDEIDRDFSKCAELISELSYMHTANPKSDPVWPESAQALLSAIIFYLLEVGYKNKDIDRLNMYTVKTFFIDKGTKTLRMPSGQTLTELDLLMQSLPLDSHARQFYATSRFAEGEMRSSINATLSSNLALYADTGLAKMTGTTEVDFSGLSSEIPTALFLIIPDDKKSRHKLVAITIKQLYTELVDLAMKETRQRLPRRVMIIADEIAQMPPFPNLDEMLSVSLGRNIMWSLYIQSFAQLNKVYGDNETRIIRDAMTNFVYILSSDPATNKEFSDMLGSGTKQFMTHSGEHGTLLESDHAQSHVKGRPLLLPDELNRLKEWEIIIKIDRHYPIRTIRTPYHELDLPVVRIEGMGFYLQETDSYLMNYEVNEEKDDQDLSSTTSGTRNNEKELPKPPLTEKENQEELSALMKAISLSPIFTAALDAENYDKASAIARELLDFGSLDQKEYQTVKEMIEKEMQESDQHQANVYRDIRRGEGQ